MQQKVSNIIIHLELCYSAVFMEDKLHNKVETTQSYTKYKYCYKGDMTNTSEKSYLCTSGGKEKHQKYLFLVIYLYFGMLKNIFCKRFC